MASYRLAKIFHFIGLITWLGPSAGGYLLLVLSRRKGDMAVTARLMDEYLRLIYIEAAGLLLLLLSGLTMRALRPDFKGASWLRRKLSIVFTVFVPLEIAQIAVYRYRVVPVLTAGGLDEALRIFDIFSLLAFVLLIVTVPAVFYLAVFKPGQKK